jgi:hypothetical protein
MLGELLDLHALAHDVEYLLPRTSGNGVGPIGGSRERPIGINVDALDLDLGNDALAILEEWERWWREWWDVFVPVATKGEPFAVVVNGDTVDGVHHGSKTRDGCAQHHAFSTQINDTGFFVDEQTQGRNGQHRTRIQGGRYKQCISFHQALLVCQRKRYATSVSQANKLNSSRP